MGRTKNIMIAEAEAAAAYSLTSISEPLFYKYIGLVNILGIMTAVYADTVNDLARKIVNNINQETGQVVTVHFKCSEQQHLEYTVQATDLETNYKTEEKLLVYLIHQHLVS